MQCVCGFCIPRASQKEADEEKESLAEEADAAEENLAIEERQAEVSQEAPPEPLREEPVHKGKLHLTAVIEGVDASAIESVKIAMRWAEGEEREVVLQKAAKQWIGGVEEIAHNQALEIRAAAYDREGKEQAQAHLRDLVARADREGALWISLRPAAEKATVRNRAPRLLGLWMEHRSGIAGEELALRVFSADDPQEEIRLRWESDSGEIKESEEDDHRFQLKLPPTPQSAMATLLLHLSDQRQGRRSLRIRLPITSSREEATPAPQYHRSPVLHSLRASLQRLHTSKKTGFQLDYEEGDGTTSFAWSSQGAGCTGRFEEAASASPSWTAPATTPPQKACKIVIRLQDSEGLFSEGETEIAFIEEAWELLLASSHSVRQVKMTQAPNGDLIIGGRFAGMMDLTGLRLLAAPSRDGHFVTRADQDGNIQWLFGMESTGQSTLRALTSAPSGDIWLWGEFAGRLSIQGQTLESAGQSDLFLARLDEKGALRGLQSFGSKGMEEAGAMKIHQDGTIYLTGSFSSAMRFGEVEKTPKGLTDGFVGALDAQGRWLWVHTASSGFFTYIPDLFVTPQGAIWVAGLFMGPLTLGDITLSYHSIFYQGFLARLDAQGGWQEAESFGEVGMLDPFLHITQAGEVILCGHFKDRLRLGAISLERLNAEFHFFLAFRDASRQWKWAREIDLLPQATYQFPGKCSALYEEGGEIYLLGVLASATVNVMDSFTCNEQSCGASFWARLDHQGRWREVECLLPSTETGPQQAAMLLTQEAWFAVLSIIRPGFFCGPPPTLPLGILLRKRPRRLLSTP